MYSMQIRKLVGKLLGRQKSRDYREHYVHEMELFNHAYTPRPWLNCKDVTQIHITPNDAGVLEYDLRRWEHAIDKGLQLPERRPGFGKDKIRCIITMITLLKRFPDRCRTVACTLEILRRYQRVLESDLADASANAGEQVELSMWAEELSAALGEFSNIECTEQTVPSPNQLSPVLFQRRSVRRWCDKPIDRNTLRLLVEAALWGPSSCNRQPSKFLFVEDPSKKALLVDTATGASGFTEFAPVICVLLNDVRAYNGPCERHLAYIDTSIAAENLALAAHELGLGAVWLNWALPDVASEKRVRKALGIPSWCAIIGLIALGHPDETVACPPPARREVDEVILFDSFQ